MPITLHAEACCPCNTLARTPTLIDKPCTKLSSTTASIPLDETYQTYQTSAMAFSFGFSGDDIEEDPNDLVADTQQSSVPGGDSTSDQPPPIPAKTHDLDELVGVGVCRISTTNRLTNDSYPVSQINYPTP